MEEKNGYKEIIASWSDSKLLEEASVYESSEIFLTYGRKLEAIAKIPDDSPLFKGIYKDIQDHHIYSSKGYFIDHAIFHHPELDQNDFMDLVDTAEEANSFFYDRRNDSVILTRKNGNKTDALVVFQKNNKIILEQTFFKSRRIPKRWEKISPMDGLPIIRQQEEPCSGSVRSISALGDTSTIPQSSLKSMENLEKENEKLQSQINKKIRTARYGQSQNTAPSVSTEPHHLKSISCYAEKSNRDIDYGMEL